MPPRSKSQRIALVFEYPTLNGGERSMLACLDWWSQHPSDQEFVAIAPGEGRLADALSARGVTIIPWSRSGTEAHLTHAAVEQSLIRAVHHADPDLVHANSLAMGRLTGRVAGRLQVPTSAHLRDIVNLSDTAIADLNQNTLLIAVSRAARQAHVARGLDPDRVVVVHNGVDLTEFQPRPSSGWLHRELGLPPDAILTATIGQISLRKGQDVLARAASAIASAVPDVHFLVIGQRSSTKAESVQFESDLREQAAAAGPGLHWHQLGYRGDIPGVMPELELIIHPANQEPFGRVLLEAAACGVPVVATNVGGTSEIVVDGQTGRLVPPRDPEALAAAVIELLADRDQRRRMSLAAQTRAVSEFDAGRCARRLRELWSTLKD